MKKIIYFFSIALAIALWVYAWLSGNILPGSFHFTVYLLSSLFLLIFGAYGLYAEKLLRHFEKQGKTANFCVEANYHVRKKGLLGRVFLFPFIKVKSRNSLVIALLGALTWLIILLIVIKTIIG